MGCKTCEAINYWKNNQSKGDYEDKLFAKISIYTWKKGERKIKGNQISTITTRAYGLQYCPTCGKNIKEMNK